jgi:hypothetical protein
MQRIQKIKSLGGRELTPDAHDAAHELQRRMRKLKVPVKFPSGGMRMPSGCSMPGRELKVECPDLRTLWSVAIPLGFTPWNRWPVHGNGDDLFHFIGPWQPILDRLLAEARGEVAWQNACCAASCDVGEWDGDAPLERFVQAQLHRVGANPGILDGVVGRRTAEALRMVGAPTDLDAAAAYLTSISPQTPPAEDGKWIGHVSIPGMTSIATYGKAASVRTPGGAALSIEGPGRVVIDFMPGENG